MTTPSARCAAAGKALKKRGDLDQPAFAQRVAERQERHRRHAVADELDREEGRAGEKRRAAGFRRAPGATIATQDRHGQRPRPPATASPQSAGGLAGSRSSHLFHRGVRAQCRPRSRREEREQPARAPRTRSSSFLTLRGPCCRRRGSRRRRADRCLPRVELRRRRLAKMIEHRGRHVVDEDAAGIGDHLLVLGRALADGVPGMLLGRRAGGEKRLLHVGGSLSNSALFIVTTLTPWL